MARNWVCCRVVLDRLVLLAAVGEKHVLFYMSLRQARRTGDGGQRWVEAASGQVTGSWGTRKTAGDRQLLDWAEGMGLLSTVNGRRPGEPRPGYYLFALRVGETPGRWARELDSTTSWVGTPPAMRCRTQWGAETSSVPIHQFGWSVECGGSKGNGIVVPLEPSSPSSILTRLCAPTRCQVRCRVSPQRTVCMEKIADLKDRPRPDGNGNSRKKGPKRRPRN